LKLQNSDDDQKSEGSDLEFYSNEALSPKKGNAHLNTSDQYLVPPNGDGANLNQLSVSTNRRGGSIHESDAKLFA
jgi:hypothetical protein